MTVAEHSFEPSLFPKKANILDIGCRGFEFTHYFKEKGHNVFSIDADHIDGGEYYLLAISGQEGRCSLLHTDDQQATHITEGDEIPKYSIQSFSKYVDVARWDLIKMDIEGEEISVLEKSKHPIASQVSVEFHAHTGRQDKIQLDILLDWLSNWYKIKNRVWEERHCAGFNYWDILLISK